MLPLVSFSVFVTEKLRDKPGYEHLNEPLHVLVEAKLPASVIDSKLNQAVVILEDLLKPVVLKKYKLHIILVQLSWMTMDRSSMGFGDA